MDVGSEVVNSEGCKMLKTDEHFDMLSFILSKRLVAVCVYNKGQ